jgi:hypothetical protein
MPLHPIRTTIVSLKYKSKFHALDISILRFAPAVSVSLTINPTASSKNLNEISFLRIFDEAMHELDTRKA